MIACRGNMEKGMVLRLKTQVKLKRWRNASIEWRKNFLKQTVLFWKTRLKPVKDRNSLIVKPSSVKQEVTGMKNSSIVSSTLHPRKIVSGYLFCHIAWIEHLFKKSMNFFKYREVEAFSNFYILQFWKFNFGTHLAYIWLSFAHFRWIRMHSRFWTVGCWNRWWQFIRFGNCWFNENLHQSSSDPETFR